jgi:hypothetical protein
MLQDKTQDLLKVLLVKAFAFVWVFLESSNNWNPELAASPLKDNLSAIFNWVR